jgi:hypothetical protein
MVGLTIAFPQMVMHYKGTAAPISTEGFQLPDSGLGGLPPLGEGTGGAQQPAQPGNDLSQPPKF